MNKKTNEIIQILNKIVEKLSMPNCDVTWSHYDNQIDAMTDVKGYIERLKKGETLEFRDLKLLFAPTDSLQEIAISNGWGNEFLTLADQFDKVIES